VSNYTHDKGRDCRRTDEVLANYKRRAVTAETELQAWHAECDKVGVPYDPAGLVRHHRGNASMAATADRMAAETERDNALAEVERLKREGTPGVMHAVDKAFYDLTVKERNAERHEVDRLRKLLLDRPVIWVGEGEDDG
jgi:hypothetical protein